MKARVISSGDIVNVIQVKPGDGYFIDCENNPYKINELDFSVCDNDSKIDYSGAFEDFISSIGGQIVEHEQLRHSIERESYYRELRGDVLMQLLDIFRSNIQNSNDTKMELEQTAFAAHHIISVLRKFSKD